MNRWPVLRGAAVMFHAASRIYGEMSGRVEFHFQRGCGEKLLRGNFVNGTPLRV